MKYSRNNSTTTPLTSGTTWEGLPENHPDYHSLSITCKTDQSGTLYFERSVDGNNWDDHTETVKYHANESLQLEFEINTAWQRVRFTNDGGDQTFMRLQTVFHNRSSSHPDKYFGNEHNLWDNSSTPASNDTSAEIYMPHHNLVEISGHANSTTNLTLQITENNLASWYDSAYSWTISPSGDFYGVVQVVSPYMRLKTSGNMSAGITATALGSKS